MRLFGQVSYADDPMNISLQGMSMQIKALAIHSDNMALADIPGYQRRVPVFTTFIEQLGQRGLNETIDTQVGRLFYTDQPLDLALATRGSFQCLEPDGRIQLSRDGRFHLDKDGYLLTVENKRVMSKSGQPIKFPYIPYDMSQVVIEQSGLIRVRENPQANQKAVTVGQIAIAAEDGGHLDKVDIRQRHVEFSNVFLHEEYVAVVPYRRNFQANRQIFLLQSQALSKMIQELGRAQ